MNDPQAEAQLFLYDLANLSKEHWFKPDEGWNLALATDAGKLAIEKQYFPTLHIKGETELLEKVYELMRPSLKLAEPGPEIPPERGTRKIPPTYLMAFNPARQRK